MLQIDTFYYTIQSESIFSDYKFSVVILLCLGIIAVLLNSNDRKIHYVPQAMLTRSGMNIILREGNLLNNHIGFMMVLLYAFSCSLFYYQLFVIRGLSLFGHATGITLYFIILTIVMSIPVIKWLFCSLMLTLIKCKEAITQLISTNIIFNFSGGIIVLPFLLLTTYTNLSFPIYIAAACLLINYTLSFIKLFLCGISFNKLSNVYFFIYLCMLKFLPGVLILLFALRYI